MKIVDSLIRNEKDGALSFGNFSLSEKSKVSDFSHEGDLYKVKSFSEITKLEKNETFVYESVPGSAVFSFRASADVVEFEVTGEKDIQITLELEPETEYEVFIDGVCAGRMMTNVSGKLTFSVDARPDEAAGVKIVKD